VQPNRKAKIIRRLIKNGSSCLISAGYVSYGLTRTAPTPSIIRLPGHAIILGEITGETERFYIYQSQITITAE
jgi:hypothetical protein